MIAPRQNWEPRDGLAGGRRHDDRLFSVAFAPGSAGDDKTVKLWDVQAEQEWATLQGFTAGVNCVAFAPDGLTLATGAEDGSVKLWGLATGQRRLTLQRQSVPVN